MERVLVNKEELAAALTVSRSFVDKQLAKGMPCVRLGSAVRFEPDAVVAWFKERA
jgi:excisionase family DNA binding protein